MTSYLRTNYKHTYVVCDEYSKYKNICETVFVPKFKYLFTEHVVIANLRDIEL